MTNRTGPEPSARSDSVVGENLRQLTTRLEAVDPDAAKALSALAFFDKLIENRAGIEGFVRGAAVLGGHTAGLSDPDCAIYMRLDPEGRRLTESVAHDERWLTRTLDTGSPARVWLETITEVGVAEEMVLDRLAMGTRLILERTRGRVRRPDEGAIEVLLDDDAPAELRRRTADSLGFRGHDRLRALAVLDSSGHGRSFIRPLVHRSGSERLNVPGRMGIGLPGGVLDLPMSYRTAVAALRVTADRRDGETGPIHATAESLGGLLALAQDQEARSRPVTDVYSLNQASSRHSELLATLDAFVTHASARAAADALHVHHSTMQLRLQQAEKVLGWPLNSASGRFRLQLAMALRLIQRDDI